MNSLCWRFLEDMGPEKCVPDRDDWFEDTKGRVAVMGKECELVS